MLQSTLTAYIFLFSVFNLGAACNGSFHFQDHESPALAALFDEALTRVVEILAKFNDSHPLIAHFNKHFEGNPSFEQSRGASEWICTFGLVPTPELEAVLQPPLHSALVHAGLTKLHEPEGINMYSRLAGRSLKPWQSSNSFASQ
ncbi:hypothetical protein DFH09DRAFT_1091441 [Mycena vulgaris]|nr:hypothetical protein DFH09DRAFT_1091441 [Mycena vulgaris]